MQPAPMSTPTIINDIPNATYDGWDAINYSSLKKFMVSPKHYQSWFLNKDNEETKDAFRFGSAVHMLCLQPEHFNARWSIAPDVDRRTKIGKEAWAVFLDNVNGRDNYLSEKEFEACLNIANSLKQNEFWKFVNDKNDEIYREAGILSEYAGCKVKGRVDFYNKTQNVIVDVKTISQTPTVKNVLDQIYSLKYHIQTFFYSKLVESVFKPENTPTFYFVFVEKTLPYSVAWFEISPEFGDYEHTKQKVEEALCRFENAKKADIWAGLENENKPYLLK